MNNVECKHEVVPKLWGFELIIVNQEYCGKQLTVVPNRYCSVHVHLIKREHFYVIDGSLRLEYAEIEMYDSIVDEQTWNASYRTIILNKGDSFGMYPKMYHRFTSATNHPCTFIEFSSHHEDSDSYRIKVD